MALTYDQKNRIAWVDVSAGLGTAFLGFVSFAIGGAASMAYYKSQGWLITPPPADPIPTTSDNAGICHNLLCQHYINDGYTTVNYTDAISVASQVRPDLTTELNNIPTSVFDDKIEWAINEDLSTPALQLNMIQTIIPLDPTDSTTVLNTLNSLAEATWVSDVGSLLAQVDGFNLSEPEKEQLTWGLQILQNSFVLWGTV